MNALRLVVDWAPYVIGCVCLVATFLGTQTWVPSTVRYRIIALGADLKKFRTPTAIAGLHRLAESIYELESEHAGAGARLLRELADSWELAGKEADIPIPFRPSFVDLPKNVAIPSDGQRMNTSDGQRVSTDDLFKLISHEDTIVDLKKPEIK